MLLSKCTVFGWCFLHFDESEGSASKKNDFAETGMVELSIQRHGWWRVMD